MDAKTHLEHIYERKAPETDYIPFGTGQKFMSQIVSKWNLLKSP